MEKPDTNQKFKEYLDYLKKHNENFEALETCQEFYNFIVNNEGFEVS